MRSLLIALLLVALAGPAPSKGLDDVADIDIVRVAKENGQVHLVLVLDPDQSASQPIVLAKVKRKLSAYRYYVTRGQVWKNEVGSNSSLPVALTVLVTGDLTQGDQSALASLKSEFQSGPTTYFVVHMPKPAAVGQKR